jgi:transcription-repair coupling factor (superfamily II helicase)
VATTIIESGLDVPNANIFINNANNFGLSDFTNARSVGRSNKKAFCYFICPPYSAMTDDARKRIQALNSVSWEVDFIMKDLEIRGAGDLLGGEQSGFINEIGFDTYQKIMNEAIDELKENEFKDLYPEESNIETKEYVKDLQIDTDFELLFSDEYINNVSERLSLYNELGTVKNEEELVFKTS